MRGVVRTWEGSGMACVCTLRRWPRGRLGGWAQGPGIECACSWAACSWAAGSVTAKGTAVAPVLVLLQAVEAQF